MIIKLRNMNVGKVLSQVDKATVDKVLSQVDVIPTR